jgi:hypothetical protein
MYQVAPAALITPGVLAGYKPDFYLSMMFSDCSYTLMQLSFATKLLDEELKTSNRVNANPAIIAITAITKISSIKVKPFLSDIKFLLNLSINYLYLLYTLYNKIVKIVKLTPFSHIFILIFMSGL